MINILCLNVFSSEHQWLCLPKYAIPSCTLEKLEKSIALTRKDEFAVADAFYMHASKNEKLLVFAKNTLYVGVGISM